MCQQKTPVFHHSEEQPSVHVKTGSPVSLIKTHGVDLVEYFPLLVRDAQLLRRLDGASELTGPHLQVWDLLGFQEPTQGFRKLAQSGKEKLTSLHTFLTCL